MRAMRAKEEEMGMEKGWWQGEGNHATGILESMKGNLIGRGTLGKADRMYTCCRHESIQNEQAEKMRSQPCLSNHKS